MVWGTTTCGYDRRSGTFIKIGKPGKSAQPIFDPQLVLSANFSTEKKKKKLNPFQPTIG
jgi:hypothetical protein